MATEKIPIPKPGDGEPIVFFDVTLGGKFFYFASVAIWVTPFPATCVWSH